MFRSLVVLTLCMLVSVTFAQTPAPATPTPTPAPVTPAPTTPAPTTPAPAPQTPNCKPAASIFDFSSAPVGYCHKMAQMINNVNTGNYSFYFNWCGLGSQESCQPSYVVQGNVGSSFCDRNFTGWTTGMTYSATQQQVSYTVNDGAGSTALITITCDPNANNGITCPTSYTVSPTTTSGQYNYVIALTSTLVCPNSPGCQGPGCPNSGQIGAGAVAGIVIAVIAGVGLLTYAFFRFSRSGGYEAFGGETKPLSTN